MKKLLRRIKVGWLSFLSLLIGMKVTMRNFLMVKPVTLDYPSQKQPMTGNFRGMVDLIPEACVICYQCIKICPVAALDLAHKQIVQETKKKNEITKFTYNAVLCCFCGLCDEICPTDAIFMNKMYEVSAYSHDQIVNIDLMDAVKYRHIDTNYNFAQEVERNKENTIGIVVNKPPPAAPASPAPSAPAAAASTSAPAASNPAANTAPANVAIPKPVTENPPIAGPSGEQKP